MVGKPDGAANSTVSSGRVPKVGEWSRPPGDLRFSKVFPDCSLIALAREQQSFVSLLPAGSRPTATGHKPEGAFGRAVREPRVSDDKEMDFLSVRQMIADQGNLAPIPIQHATTMTGQVAHSSRHDEIGRSALSSQPILQLRHVLRFEIQVIKPVV